MSWLGKLGGRKFVLTLIGNLMVMFLDIDTEAKAQLLTALNSVYVGAQGLADAVSKGKTATPKG